MYREYPEVLASSVGSLFTETLDRLFDTFRALQKPVAEVLRGEIPLEDQTFEVTVNEEKKETRKVKFSEIRTLQGIDVEKEEKTARAAYEAAIKAKVFDLTRGPFPAAIMTNLGWHGAYRSFDHSLRKMLASDYPPAITTAHEIHDALSSTEPHLIAGVQDSHGLAEIKQLKERNNGIRKIAREIPQQEPDKETESGVRLVYADKSYYHQASLAATTLYPYNPSTFGSLQNVAFQDELLMRSVIHAAGDGRTNRRHKLPRSFELTTVAQEFVGNFGVYRDLERNRFTLHIRKPLTTKLGYDMPAAISKAGMENAFVDAMEASDRLYLAMMEKVPAYAELAVTFAHRLRWLAIYDMRQAAHFHAIRTIPEGHPDYRNLMQEASRNLLVTIPDVASVAFKFVNMQEHQLERLAAAHRTEKKLVEIEGRTTQTPSE